MAKIITISNPKGGVGKTTTSINLAASLAIAEKKVLLIDIDPDGATGTGLGFSRDKIKLGMKEIYQGTATPEEAIHNSNFPNLKIIPCNVWTSEEENLFIDKAKDRDLLKKLVTKITELDNSFDFIIIDSPPSLGDLTIGALMASDSVLIPLQCGHFAFKAVGRLMGVVRQLRLSENPKLKIEGILLTFFERGTRVSAKVIEEAHLVFKGLLFKTIIPKNTALGYAAYEEKPAISVNATSAGSLSHLSLANEILQKSQ